MLPWLRPGRVIRDNLRVHYRCRVRQLIEQAFCKRKAHLQAAAARTVPALLDAIAAAIRTISPQDISGWFNHCGYPVAHSL